MLSWRCWKGRKQRFDGFTEVLRRDRTNILRNIIAQYRSNTILNITNSWKRTRTFFKNGNCTARQKYLDSNYCSCHWMIKRLITWQVKQIYFVTWHNINQYYWGITSSTFYYKWIYSTISNSLIVEIKNLSSSQSQSDKSAWTGCPYEQFFVVITLVLRRLLTWSFDLKDEMLS